MLDDNLLFFQIKKTIKIFVTMMFNLYTYILKDNILIFLLYFWIFFFFFYEIFDFIPRKNYP